MLPATAARLSVKRAKHAILPGTAATEIAKAAVVINRQSCDAKTRTGHPCRVLRLARINSTKRRVTQYLALVALEPTVNSLLLNKANSLLLSKVSHRRSLRHNKDPPSAHRNVIYQVSRRIALIKMIVKRFRSGRYGSEVRENLPDLLRNYGARMRG